MNNQPSKLDTLWARLFFIQLGLFTLFLFGGICLNWSIAIAKAYGWYWSEIDFWVEKKYGTPLIFTLAMPVGWGIFGYFFAVRRAMIIFYESELILWNRQLAQKISAVIWTHFHSKKEKSINPYVISDALRWINAKIQALPKLIAWVANKLIGKISLVDLIVALDEPEFRKADQIDIQAQVMSNLNTLAESSIRNALARPLYLIFVLNGVSIIWILIV